MKPTPPRRHAALPTIALGLTLLLLSGWANAQGDQSTVSSDRNPAGLSASGPSTHQLAVDTRAFQLSGPIPENYADLTSVEKSVQTMLPSSAKVYLDYPREILFVQGTPSQLDLADKIVRELNRPHKSYRLTYTVTEVDAGKTTSTEHYSTILTSGQQSILKEGDKVPVATGSYSNGSTETQFTYLDVGMNIESTIASATEGFILKLKIERSSLSTPVTISNVQEPVVRQRVLQTTSKLTLDKPVMLGSMDVPGSTHRIDIAAVIEPNR